MFNLLEGIRIVDLTTIVPGPYATQLLADMGAQLLRYAHRSRLTAGLTMRSNPTDQRQAWVLMTRGAVLNVLQIPVNTADIDLVF